MAFGVVLDACVLYPFSLCDILLRLAERELFDVYWSDRILDEVERNLVQDRLTPEQAARRIDRMRAVFPAATASGPAVTRIEPSMTNDAKDRHVLAAAVVSSADAVVTLNLRDFPTASCEPLDIEVIHPDEFLLSLLDLNPDIVASEVVAQAQALTRPPVPHADLLAMLDKAGVPRFAARLR